MTGGGVTGRASLLAFVAATGGVHLLPALPGHSVRIGLCVVALVVTLTASLVQRHSLGRVLWLVPVWAALAGFLFTVMRADARLNDALADSNVNLVSRVELRVASLPQRQSGMQSFDAHVINSVPAGVPKKLRVSWRTGSWSGPYAKDEGWDATDQAVVPGQVWRMALILKPPHGSRNPNGFDYEAYTFANGVRAMGTVRGIPELLRDEPWHDLGVVAERTRYKVREFMSPHLEGKRYGAVLLALAIGDQASVEADDWIVFNRTGITHLVSISGTHVTMIASLGGILIVGVWRRVRFRGRLLAERVPAQVVGALAALLVAWFYCLLAGWGVPAQRTFLMLAIIASAYVLRISMGASRLLLLAAFAVVALDPWAMLSSGFWLSFGAVAVLMAMSSAGGRSARTSRPGFLARTRGATVAAARLQLMITAALLPALALLFNEVSIASPLANAYAIPVISLLVTPLALLAAVTSALPGTEAIAGFLTDSAHWVLQAMMWPTVWLSDQAVSSITVATSPAIVTLLALAGLGMVLLPRGLFACVMGWIFVLPALTWLPARPPHGGWDAIALDVGQASAIVIQTARHNVLFDTGVRNNSAVDSGIRVISPFFRSQGIQRLDAVIVSHADIDHVGGLRSVLDAMQVGQTYSSFSVEQWLKREASMLDIDDTTRRPLAMSVCRYGQQWTVDGVTFQFLWPLHRDYSSMQASSRERNDHSCVLRVQGRHHSLLLTGDIGVSQEQELTERGIGVHDVVMAAHHGSNNSSGAGFIQAVQARHAVVQAGAWSRYGHPHPKVVRRWTDAGATLWRTDLHGAVVMRSREGGLKLAGERQRKRRYWQVW